MKADLAQRDKEIQDFFDSDYKSLQVKHDASEERCRAFQLTITKLQSELQEAQMAGASEQAVRPLIDEVKKKSQLLLVRDSEIESLKQMVRELKATVEQDESSKELQELKKREQFLQKEKSMKDLMIDQMKKELEKNIEHLMVSKEKEAQMAAVINALTVQNAMMGTASTTKPSGAAAQEAPQQSPSQPKKKPNNRLSLV